MNAGPISADAGNGRDDRDECNGDRRVTKMMPFDPKIIGPAFTPGILAGAMRRPRSR